MVQLKVKRTFQRKLTLFIRTVFDGWRNVAKKQHGLRVKPSQIQNAGFGLYATKHLAKNERVAPYTGEQRTRDQITQEYGTDTGQYVLCRSDAECFDAFREWHDGLAAAAVRRDVHGCVQESAFRLRDAVPK